jgi:hypothetical protein
MSSRAESPCHTASWRGRPALASRGHPGLASWQRGTFVSQVARRQDAGETQGRDGLATSATQMALAPGVTTGRGTQSSIALQGRTIIQGAGVQATSISRQFSNLDSLGTTCSTSTPLAPGLRPEPIRLSLCGCQRGAVLLAEPHPRPRPCERSPQRLSCLLRWHPKCDKRRLRRRHAGSAHGQPVAWFRGLSPSLSRLSFRPILSDSSEGLHRRWGQRGVLR